MTINVFPRHTRSVAQNRQMAADARFRSTNNRRHGDRLDCDTGMLEAQREIDRHSDRYVCEARTHSPFCVIRFRSDRWKSWDREIIGADTWEDCLIEMRSRWLPLEQTAGFAGHAVSNTAQQGVA
jgi:hypothetical protein